jgi:hypothetical protein
VCFNNITSSVIHSIKSSNDRRCKQFSFRAMFEQLPNQMHMFQRTAHVFNHTTAWNASIRESSEPLKIVSFMDYFSYRDHSSYKTLADDNLRECCTARGTVYRRVTSGHLTHPLECLYGIPLKLSAQINGTRECVNVLLYSRQPNFGLLINGHQPTDRNE